VVESRDVRFFGVEVVEWVPACKRWWYGPPFCPAGRLPCRPTALLEVGLALAGK